MLTWLFDDAFNTHCSPRDVLSTENSKTAASEELGRSSWYILHIMMKGEQLCSFASKLVLHNDECKPSSWTLTVTGRLFKVNNVQLYTCWLEFVKIWSTAAAKSDFQSHIMYIKWKSESTQRLDLWSLPHAYFGRIKNSIAPCSLTESKLPSSNVLGDADVLQGPHGGHRHGRKRRHICPFLTGVKFVSKLLSLNIHTPSTSPKPEESRPFLISCVNSGAIRL